MVMISDFVYKIWIGKEIVVPFLLTSLMGVFFALVTWNTIFVYFINGVSKIKLQLYTSLFLTVLNIPLSVFFAKTLNMGVSGVIMGTIVCVFAGTILHPIQYYKIINNKARGIWNK
jgi:Na+-driven multidrug efflux pump